jgi:hypothetical protein
MRVIVFVFVIVPHFFTTGNIRSLLSTLGTILPADSGWKEVSLAELVEDRKVKITYHKALLIVHPDKVVGRPVEERLLAERVWDTLQEAFSKTKS